MTARPAATWAAAHPLTAFTVLALGITWIAWAPTVLASYRLLPAGPAPLVPVLFVVGGTGPLLAAWLVLRAQHGPAAGRRLFAPLTRWRVRPGWYVLALAGPVLLALGALAVLGRLDRVADLGASWAWSAVLLVRLVAAVPEEAAWRGFALPRWQERWNGTAAALVLGVVWAAWHLPLLLDRSNPMSAYPLPLYVLSVLATSVVWAWVFNSTGRSVLVLVLLHGTGNAVGDVLFAGDTALWRGFQAVEAVVMTVLALVVALMTGPDLASPRPRRRATEEMRQP
ncbi:hypothetical protein AS188_07575 [Kocuria flava]|uniref:CAAX amino protease n=1 Tax=Kocuria flava TaxID=446860 RepID=A0A0U3GK02_9MICC|nr:type II CAAX endopeptidase family protein [Kocuria flava]ALU39635.1 hypothetical protein AS188_07575 [Kocuria flava]GEO92011.1 CAAX amino protease [Kocuria flava]